MIVSTKWLHFQFFLSCIGIEKPLFLWMFSLCLSILSELHPRRDKTLYLATSWFPFNSFWVASGRLGGGWEFTDFPCFQFFLSCIKNLIPRQRPIHVEFVFQFFLSCIQLYAGTTYRFTLTALSILSELHQELCHAWVLFQVFDTFNSFWVASFSLFPPGARLKIK